MNSPIRPTLFAGTALLSMLLVLGGVWQYFGSATANDQAAGATSGTKKTKPTKRAGC